MTDEQEPPATGEEIAALGRPLPQQPEPEPAQSTQAEDSAERLRGVPVPEEIPFFDYFSPENDPKYISFKQDIVTLKQKLSGATSREELEQMIKESNDDEEFHNKLDTTTYAHDHMALSFPLDLTELKTTVYCDANGNLSLEEPVQQAIEETKAKPEVAVGPFGLPLEEKKTETPPPKPPPKKKAEQPKLEPERPEQAPENNLKRLEGLIGINAKSLKTLLEKFATNIDTYIDMNDGTCLCLFKGENYEGTLFVDARNKIPFEFKYKFNDGEEQVSNFRTLDDLEERLRTIAVEKELQSMLSKMNPKNLQEQLDTNNENTTKNIKAIHQIYIGGPLTQKMADSIFNWVKEVKKKLPGEIKKNEPLKDLVLIVDAINSGEIPDPLPQDVIDEARKKSHSKLSSELSLLDPDKGLLEKELTENRDATLEKINGFLSRIKSRFPLDTESMFSDIRDWVEKVKNHSEIEEFKKCGPLNELILFVDANKKSTDDEP